MATHATPQQYDPLDYDNLAQNVVRALLEQPRQKLAPAPFEGVGVYALYYLGDLDCYKATRGEDIPIYVGSAVLAGKRKGGKEATAGRTLHNRLVQHAKSIQQAENLRLEDFHCRYLVVVPVWIEFAERPASRFGQRYSGKLGDSARIAAILRAALVVFNVAS
jgi:hypothetical protein